MLADSTLDTFDAVTGRAGFPVNPRTRTVAAEHAAAIAAVELDRDLNPAARARKIEERASQTMHALAALQEADRVAAVLALDAEEGALRAALKPPAVKVEAFALDAEKRQAELVRTLQRTERRALLADLVAEVAESEPAAVLDAAADVACYEDAPSTIRAYRAAVRRLEALHEAAPEGQRAALFEALVSAKDNLRQHLSVHPGPTRALRDIARRRGRIEAQVVGHYRDTLPRLIGLIK